VQTDTNPWIVGSWPLHTPSGEPMSPQQGVPEFEPRRDGRGRPHEQGAAAQPAGLEVARPAGLEVAGPRPPTT
jgi:hypothetical protein